MEGRWTKKRVWALMVVTLMSSLLRGMSGRSPVLHRVGGGRNTWAPNINFTKWASRELFYVGDWLYFGFDKHRYNVLQVNKTGYETCTDKDFIRNITRGGRDVFNLTQAKAYYFLSGGGYCFHGMRLSHLRQGGSKNRSCGASTIYSTKKDQFCPQHSGQRPNQGCCHFRVPFIPFDMLGEGSHTQPVTALFLMLFIIFFLGQIFN